MAASYDALDRPVQMSQFRVFRDFNQADSWLARWRRRIDPVAVERLGQRGRIQQVLEALATERCIRVKEVVESFEVYACVHKRLNSPKIIDLCCGHGLTGYLFAIFGRHIEEVILLDREESISAGEVQACLELAFPEIRGRVRRITSTLKKNSEVIDERTSLVAVHACGSRTDRCIDLAISHNRPIVAVPCCYSGTGQDVPRALRTSLGVELATDIGRTYRLENAGFAVEWDSIPEAVTPMNRVLIAHPDGVSPGFQRAQT